LTAMVAVLLLEDCHHDYSALGWAWSPNPAVEDLRAPDPFQLNHRACMRCVNHVAAPGVDPHVVDGAAGVEEDEVALAPRRRADPDRGQVLLLGYARDGLPTLA